MSKLGQLIKQVAYMQNCEPRCVLIQALLALNINDVVMYLLNKSYIGLIHFGANSRLQ